jgi:hypothetical protein
LLAIGGSSVRFGSNPRLGARFAAAIEHSK